MKVWAFYGRVNEDESSLTESMLFSGDKVVFNVKATHRRYCCIAKAETTTMRGTAVQLQ